MSGTSTERVEFDEIHTHGQPVRLSEEIPDKLPGAVAPGEDPRVEVKTNAAADGKPSKEDQNKKVSALVSVTRAGKKLKTSKHRSVRALHGSVTLLTVSRWGQR